MVDKNLRDGEICVGPLASEMAAATENEFNSCGVDVDEPKLVVVVCIGWLGLFLDLTFFMAIAASVLVLVNYSRTERQLLSPLFTFGGSWWLDDDDVIFLRG